mgnify:CR=1 FL=1
MPRDPASRDPNRAQPAAAPGALPVTSRRDLLRGRWFQPEERVIPKAAPQLVPLTSFRPTTGTSAAPFSTPPATGKETPPPWKKS